MTDRKPTFSLDELARQLAETVPQNLRVLRDDLERNFKSMLNAGLERMELVTREEFDVQAAVLERTREKLTRIQAPGSLLDSIRRARVATSGDDV